MQIGLGIQRRLGGSGGLVIPNSDELVSYTKPILDSRGSSSRTIFKPISGLFAVGDYLTGDIASGTTVVSEEGTGAISLSEDRLDYTDTKFLWSFVLSNGSIYEHPTIVGTDAIWFDLSGNERHLTANTADINAHTHEDDTLTFGSDWLNQMGWSDGTGGYAGVSIPADITGLLDILGNALDYPGRAKYNLELVNNPTTLFDGVGDYITLASTIVSSGDFEIEIIHDGLDFGVAYEDILYGGSWNADITIKSECYLRIFAANTIRATFNQAGLAATLTLDFTIADVSSGILIFKRVGTDITVSNNSSTDTKTDTLSIPFLVDDIASASSNPFKGSIHSATIKGIHFPLEESSGTTIYGYETDGTTHTGTVTAGDIGAFWSGEQDGENHNYLYGYELSGSVKVPANPNTGLSVLGNALTVLPRRLTDQIWQHPECMDIRTIDIDCGNDYFYDSASSYTAFARSLTEWQALDGSDQVFQGPNGVAIYDTDQGAAAQVKINKILGN